MFYHRHFDEMRDHFANQFEAEGADFLYRRSMKGAPIRVSASERDAFLADFRRQYRLGFWSFLLLVMLAIAGLVAFLPGTAGSDSVPSMIGGFIVVPLIIWPGVHWVWNAPARALKQRQAVGFERGRDEMRAIKFARITYGNLALGALAVPLLLWKVSDKADVLHGWGRLWLFLAAGLVVLVAIQAFRKWRFERRSQL